LSRIDCIRGAFGQSADVWSPLWYGHGSRILVKRLLCSFAGCRTRTRKGYIDCTSYSDPSVALASASALPDVRVRSRTCGLPDIVGNVPVASARNGSSASHSIHTNRHCTCSSHAKVPGAPTYRFCRKAAGIL
jgi:hypothetical protein